MGNESRDSGFDLEYFFELSPDLLCIAGYDGFFKKINPSVSKTLGYTNEELLAKPINSFIHPDDRELTSAKRQSIREDYPLSNFENRYITKTGETVWLSWTSMPVKRDKLVFAIAKIIIYKKKLEEYWRISNLLNADYPNVRSFHKLVSNQNFQELQSSDLEKRKDPELLPADQILLNDIEAVIRKYIGRVDLNMSLISNELHISERQLFRRVRQILSITPNKFVKIIRFKMATEAIATGKYGTLAEISNIAGFETPAYFSKLFSETYGINVLDVLNKGFQGGKIPND